MLLNGLETRVGRAHAAPVADISGSIGMSMGADIFNVQLLLDLGVSNASIGETGMSDGVLVTGITAVLRRRLFD